MSEIKSYRKHSKIDWGSSAPNERQIQLGCLLRIADATEALSINHTSLISENARLKIRVENLLALNAKLYNSQKAYKGVITKLKKRLNNVII